VVFTELYNPAQQLDENQIAFHVIHNVELHNSQAQHVNFFDVASTLNRKNKVPNKREQL